MNTYVTQGNFVIGQLTQKDIDIINNNATAGYKEERNVVTSLAKKLAVKALKTSAPYVQKQLAKKIGTKKAKKVAVKFFTIANYIEKVQNVQVTGISSILIKGGLAPDVAIEVAKWIVLFFGL